MQYGKDGNGVMISRERLRISEESNVDTVQYIVSICVHVLTLGRGLSPCQCWYHTIVQGTLGIQGSMDTCSMRRAHTNIYVTRQFSCVNQD